MNKEITVKLPLNVNSTDIHLFEPFLSYQLTPQKVKIFKNVFVTYSGFCLNNRGLIKECHHDDEHQIDDYRNQASLYYYSALDHPDNLIILDDDNTYLLIHHPWYNYYHWICECIFRAWMVRKKKHEMVLLLPDYYRENDFINGSLEPFMFKNIYFIPSHKSLMVKTLCLPQIKAKVDSYDYKMMSEVKQFYLNYVRNVKKIDINLGERVYISRSKALRKKVENEDQIKPILKNYNFIILNNEDYTFWEQVSIYSNVKFLVSIHGSGLTNMLFMQGGASVLEFHKIKTNDKDWHSKAFWYQAEALNHKYFQQLCQPTDINDDYFNANFIVDPQILESNLLHMLNVN